MGECGRCCLVRSGQDLLGLDGWNVSRNVGVLFGVVSRCSLEAKRPGVSVSYRARPLPSFAPLCFVDWSFADGGYSLCGAWCVVAGPTRLKHGGVLVRSGAWEFETDLVGSSCVPPTSCGRSDCVVVHWQMQKLKDENNALSRKIKELDDRLFQIKRSGCGSGCGRVAAGVGAGGAGSGDANKSSAGSDGDGSSTSSSSSRCPPSPTRATRANESEDAGNNRTYNLRRRGKTIDEGVRTRRGGGLRDVTNAS